MECLFRASPTKTWAGSVAGTFDSRLSDFVQTVVTISAWIEGSVYDDAHEARAGSFRAHHMRLMGALVISNEYILGLERAGLQLA